MFWKATFISGLGLYTLLSAGDWMLTLALLRVQPGAVESNPFAAACLEQYGWDGLAVYKTGATVVFLSAVVLIVRRRPVVGGTLLATGCAALLTVTTYTHNLIRAAHQEQRRYKDVELDVPNPNVNYAASSLPVPEQCWFAPSPSGVANATPTR